MCYAIFCSDGKKPVTVKLLPQTTRAAYTERADFSPSPLPMGSYLSRTSLSCSRSLLMLKQ